MVFLNRIYTRTGDDGTTGLGDGQRVPKHSLRIRAYGGVDELNSQLGLARAAGLPADFDLWIARIQNDLFDLGADLCTPEQTAKQETPPLRVLGSQVEQLERWIDECNRDLEPLTSFVLPGGSAAAAHLHVARTVCRRVEIEIVALLAHEQVNACVCQFINRLSDLLFVMARACNDNGKCDVLWKPGGGRES